MSRSARGTSRRVVAGMMVAVMPALALACEPAICREEGLALYQRRIEPLFSEDRPTTCNQCHLSGVDLTLFVRETPCETMACLVELDLVDLDAPERSLVLSWIGRAQPDSALITQDVIAAEHDGFLEWITHTAVCGGIEACAGTRCGPAPIGACDLRVVDVQESPYEPDPADCSPLARERAFLHRVYAWRGRCFPCHYRGTDLGVPGAPRWIEAERGCGPASIASMANLFALDVIDWDDPARSRFLRKPLSVDAGGLPHGGHDKYATTDDEMYQSVLGWIEYEAGCRR
ncbi:MAG: hypothetical protein KF729_26275 [Sandaracinaceae bacterium]|nr:hypothetical protein [Sandaracinaceae bacterium]